MATLHPTIIFIVISLCFPVSYSTPFALFHGVINSCVDSLNLNLTESLVSQTGSYGRCVEIGNGVLDSVIQPMMKQVELACNEVKKDENFKEGYNIIGISQGGLIARGVIELCDGPPVKNFISVGGPQAGVAAVASCGELFGVPVRVDLSSVISPGVYEDRFQDHIAPSGYFKNPLAIDAYLKGSKFLPKLNNEIPEERNAAYKERFSSLEKLVLIMFENDTVVIPNNSSWFGYYPKGDARQILPPQETNLYTEDLFGLKTLDEAGKIEYFSAPGGHVNITQSVIEDYILPYLVDKTPAKPIIKGMLQGSPTI